MDPAAVEPDLAAVSGHGPPDQVEGGGLSRAVRADEGSDGALLDRECAVVHCAHAAEPLLEPLDLEQWRPVSRDWLHPALDGLRRNSVQPPPGQCRGALGAAPLPELLDRG